MSTFTSSMTDLAAKMMAGSAKAIVDEALATCQDNPRLAAQSIISMALRYHYEKLDTAIVALVLAQRPHEPLPDGAGTCGTLVRSLRRERDAVADRLKEVASLLSAESTPA